MNASSMEREEVNQAKQAKKGRIVLNKHKLKIAKKGKSKKSPGLEVLHSPSTATIYV